MSGGYASWWRGWEASQPGNAPACRLWQRARVGPLTLEVVRLPQARAQTGGYLDWLLGTVGRAVADWEPLGQVTDRLIEEAPKRFKDLRHFDYWHPTNVSRTYTPLEADL